jgi:ribosomal-protein-alanine N-acetyltransferase
VSTRGAGVENGVGHRFPVLETERLRLREPRRSDAERLLAAWRDEETMLYFGTEPLRTRREAMDEIQAFREQASSGEGIRWIITERERDEYVGDIGFFNFAPEHGRAEIGFLLAKPVWGRGLMGEALAATLQYGFVSKDLHRVEALVDPRNAACLRVLERRGFRREGILRDYEFERDAFIDLVLLSMLGPEWGGAEAERRSSPDSAET